MNKRKQKQHKGYVVYIPGTRKYATGLHHNGSSNPLAKVFATQERAQELADDIVDYARLCLKDMTEIPKRELDSRDRQEIAEDKALLKAHVKSFSFTKLTKCS